MRNTIRQCSALLAAAFKTRRLIRHYAVEITENPEGIFRVTPAIYAILSYTNEESESRTISFCYLHCLVTMVRVLQTKMIKHLIC